MMMMVYFKEKSIYFTSFYYDVDDVAEWRNLWRNDVHWTEEGSYLPCKRNSPESEQIENAPLAILISTEHG